MKGERFLGKLPKLEELCGFHNRGLRFYGRVSNDFAEEIKKNIRAIEDSIEELTSLVRYNQGKDLTVFRSPGPLIVSIRGLKAADLLKFDDFEMFPVKLIVSDEENKVFNLQDSIKVDVSETIQITAPRRRNSIVVDWDLEGGQINFSARLPWQPKDFHHGFVLELTKDPLANFNQEENDLGKALALAEVVGWLGQTVWEKLAKIRKTA